MSEFKEDTKPLLRPSQTAELEDEKRRLYATLHAPPHVRNQLHDLPAMNRQYRAVSRTLETQTPQPYDGTKLDAAYSREKELRESILAGMPTQAEMRKTPTGAVDKHIAWERRNKQRLLEWKNIRLRLQASGAVEGAKDAADVANFERFRPAEARHELPMHGTLIQCKDFHFPNGPVPVTNVAPEEDKQRYQDETLDVIRKLAAEGHPNYKRALSMVENLTKPEALAKLQEKPEEQTKGEEPPPPWLNRESKED